MSGDQRELALPRRGVHRADERLVQLLAVGERTVPPGGLGDPRRVLEQRAEARHEGRAVELVDRVHRGGFNQARRRLMRSG